MRGIYKITNTINNKCYIGKSEDLAKRLKYHTDTLVRGSNKNKHMQNAYNMYGPGTFTVEILEDLDDDVDINEREKYWISFYQSSDDRYGYNRTKGGDGGNSYVDCMAEEEREEHYKKHKEIRTGENNPVYGKRLYNDGIQQKYLSDNEIDEYVSKCWRPGALDSFKKKCRDRSVGENNPFYGKKHSQETLDKIRETKEKNGFDMTGTVKYYKNGAVKYIHPEEIELYEKDGWTNVTPSEICKKISESKRKYFNDPEWRSVHIKNIGYNYKYDDKIFYSQMELRDYLRANGYPTIGISTIKHLIYGDNTIYIDLIGKIKKIEKGE